MLQRCLSVILMLALVVSAHAAGMTPGANTPTGQIALCIGGHAVTVLVDAEGRPVDVAHVCPDCALADLVPVAAPGRVDRAEPGDVSGGLSGAAALRAAQGGGTPPVRGPPFRV